MANVEEKVLMTEGCTVQVVESISKNGSPYKVFRLILDDGTVINAGFVNVYTELTLIRAGLLK